MKYFMLIFFYSVRQEHNIPCIIKDLCYKLKIKKAGFPY